MSAKSRAVIICCQHCKRTLSFSEGGKIKLRIPSRIIAFEERSLEGGGMVADVRCPHCKRDTNLPIRLLVRG